MDNKALIAIIVSMVVGLVVLIVEYLIIQPLGVRGLFGVVAVILAAFLILEYRCNKILPAIGLQSLKVSLDPFVKNKVVPLWVLIGSTIHGFVMSVPTLLSIVIAGSSYFVEIGIIEFTDSSDASENMIIVLLVTIMLFFLSSVLKAGYKGVYRLTVLICSASFIFLYIPTYTYMSDGSDLTLMENVFPVYSSLSRIEIQRMVSTFVAIVIFTMWRVGTIFFNSREFSLAVEDRNSIDEQLYSLLESDEALAILEKQNTLKLEYIQKGWAEFIDYPTDDYIYYIRHCVPIKVNNQTITLGYVNRKDKSMLDDVKFALQTDMKLYYRWKILNIEYVQISVEERNRILINSVKLRDRVKYARELAGSQSQK